MPVCYTASSMNGTKRILVTGGAGFIGSHLVDRLIQLGHQVRILDNLEPQVHGPERNKPPYLNPQAEFILGDIRDRKTVENAIAGVQVVFHDAAAVGVAQSMYEMDRYVQTNSWGTAVLLQAILDTKPPLEKLVVASSMSIYGEGDLECPQHGRMQIAERRNEQLANRRWEPECHLCGSAMKAVPTQESRILYPTSIYAITKKDQEDMCLLFGKSYRIPVVALRYFNVYGSRQALSNPYTGVVAIFASRLLNNHRPLVFEDGGQLRDFVHVSDIARANVMAMENSGADGMAINIGSRSRISVLQIARELARLLNKPIEPEILQNFRAGDIRHCFADTSLAAQLLGYTATCGFSDGIAETVSWLCKQTPEDRVEASIHQLKQFRLTE